jgi:hypothetical protein
MIMLDGEECGQDMLYASSHLDVLSTCSNDDNTLIRKLYTTLRVIYDDLRESVSSPIYCSMKDMGILVQDRALVSASYYDAVEGAAEVSENIVNTTRRLMGVFQESLNM